MNKSRHDKPINPSIHLQLVLKPRTPNPRPRQLCVKTKTRPRPMQVETESRNKTHLCTAVVAQKLHLNWYNYKCINNVENNVKNCLLHAFYKINIYIFKTVLLLLWYCLIISYYNIKIHISYSQALILSSFCNNILNFVGVCIQFGDIFDTVPQ